MIGTVNICLLIDYPLSEVGIIKALTPAMEAKAYTLTKLTGALSTTSDSCLIFSFKGSEYFAVNAAAVGKDIGRAVRKVIEEGVSSYWKVNTVSPSIM